MVRVAQESRDRSNRLPDGGGMDERTVRRIKRYARHASRQLILLALAIAPILSKGRAQRKALNALLIALGNEGHIPVTPVKRVAKLFHEIPPPARIALQRGFLQWDDMARALRARADRERLLDDLQEADLDGELRLMQFALVKPKHEPDIARILRALERIEGKAIGSAESDGYHLVLRAADGTQLLVYPARRGPIRVHVYPEMPDEP